MDIKQNHQREKQSLNQGSAGRKGVSFFEKHPFFILALIFLTGILMVVFHMNELSSRLIRSMANENADIFAHSLEAFRSLYTSEVVERIRPRNIEITHDYKEKEGAIPLPATFSMILGEHIGNQFAGVKTRLYSDYPFPWRQQEGRLDKYEQEALTYLREHPTEHFSRIEKFEGRQSIRFSTADVMRPACVQCHNLHPQSPKKDWKVGDVRGVLEVIHPLDRFLVETREGLRGTFFLIIGILLTGCVLLFLLTARLRQTSIQLKERSVELEKAIQLAGREHFETEKALQETEAGRLEVEKALKIMEESKKELERMNAFMLGREIKMMELKQEIKNLKKNNA